MTAKTVFLSLLLALTAVPGKAQKHDSLAVAALRAELEQMRETDQGHRAQVDSLTQIHGSDSEEVRLLWKKQTAIDEKNIARLQEIIAEYGWPGKSLVGRKAASAAFLVLQHADYDYQKQYLPLVREAFHSGELDGQYLALLEDRVLMREGKKQLYGTQLTRNQETDQLELYPIEDEINVDQRREEMGLMPLVDYLNLLGLEYKAPRQ